MRYIFIKTCRCEQIVFSSDELVNFTDDIIMRIEPNEKKRFY